MFFLGVMVVLDGQEHFSNWHIFLIVCAIPTPLAVIGLLALPESPRILLQIGHESEALVIYQVRNECVIRFLSIHSTKSALRLLRGARTI